MFKDQLRVAGPVLDLCLRPLNLHQPVNSSSLTEVNCKVRCFSYARCIKPSYQTGLSVSTELFRGDADFLDLIVLHLLHKLCARQPPTEDC